MQVAETIRSLDPRRAEAFKAAIQNLIVVALPEKPAPEVDAKGWPIGYWEHFAGILADDELEPPDDTPPEPHPY